MNHKKTKVIWLAGTLLLAMVGGCGCNQANVQTSESTSKQATQETEVDVMDDHGLQMFMTYEELKEKQNNKETFVVYIGRQTCPYCAILTPVLEEKKEFVSSEVSFYYFNVINYKQAILDEVEGAQERWDSLKEEVGFTYIPCILYYKDGKLENGFYSFLGKDYSQCEDEQKKVEMMDEAIVNLENWFRDCGIYTK